LSLYVYAFVMGRASKPLGLGMARKPLRTLRVQNARIVFEETDAPPPSARTLRAHDRVVRRLGRSFEAVLPVRYGSVASDRAALKERVRAIADPVERALLRVGGAVQFTLRVSGRAAKPVVSRGGGPGTRFMAERIARYRIPEIASLTERARPYVRALKEERTATARSFATAYHLVPRSEIRRYRSAVRAAIPDLRVSVSLTGPWPPYAFTELE
jgi:hypothetical protein